MSLLLGACASTGSKEYKGKRSGVERVAFNAADIHQGNAKTMLVGRAFLNARHTLGEYVGSFIEVVLNPVSGASEQWYSEVCRKGHFLTGVIDKNYKRRVFTTKTNDFGQFAFPNIPEGEYFLTMRLYWMDTKPMTGPVEYGGLLAKRVRLSGPTQTIDLSDQDRCTPYFY